MHICKVSGIPKTLFGFITKTEITTGWDLGEKDKAIDWTFIVQRGDPPILLFGPCVVIFV